MDRMIYTAMTGTQHIMEQQATNSQNLANANSTGFRAQIDAFRAVPIQSSGSATRVFVVDATVGADFSSGEIETTSRPLDVAVQGKGWLSVTRDDGSEAYTRNGALHINENGLLQTSTGETVLGDGGPISIPPDVAVTIGNDGTISSVANLALPGAVNVLGRLKLVNPDANNLVRGKDGLFETRDGNAAEADPAVKVIGGALEGSNVNVIDAMVNMINLGRQYDAQTQLLKNAQDNDTKAGQIFSLT